MSVEQLTAQVSVWITQYVALFCLVTMLTWGIASYLFLAKWHRTVRDCAVYFAAAGALMLLLYCCPAHGDVVLWRPVTWFAFSMLMVLELLWIVFMLDCFLQFVRKLPRRLAPTHARDAIHSPTHYSRR